MTRRRLLQALGIASCGLFLPGCLEVDPQSAWWRWLTPFEQLNRLVFGEPSPSRRVRTYPASAISTVFRVNSLNLPDTYAAGGADGWSRWRLVVDGLVERPRTFTLAELRSWPGTSQITRLDCVEGWSAVARWTGVPLVALMDRVGVKPEARYVVCYAADADDDGIPFYGSLDLASARHPQTLLAYEFNDGPLPLDHGAPLRLVLPSQLGYKNTKFIHRIALVDDFSHLGSGQGGYWEDQGYAWYAGI